MIGAEGVARAVFRRLRDAMPPKLAEFRIKYDCDIRVLPDLAFISPDELDPISLEKFPAIFVFVNRTTGRIDGKQTEAGTEYDEYSYAYEVKIYTYSRGNGDLDTSRQLKRFTLAVRECLLGDKLLALDAYDEGGLEIDPRTMAESYSSVDKQEASKRYIAASETSVNVISTERLNSVRVAVPVVVEPSVYVTGNIRSNLTQWMPGDD